MIYYRIEDLQKSFPEENSFFFFLLHSKRSSTPRRYLKSLQLGWGLFKNILQILQKIRDGLAIHFWVGHSYLALYHVLKVCCVSLSLSLLESLGNPTEPSLKYSYSICTEDLVCLESNYERHVNISSRRHDLQNIFSKSEKFQSFL